jgi:hypothetical protein
MYYFIDFKAQFINKRLNVMSVDNINFSRKLKPNYNSLFSFLPFIGLPFEFLE